MPKFFFDCFDGIEYLIDEHGIALRSKTEARDHAIVLVHSLLAEEVTEQEAKIVNVTVRGAYGPPIYVANCAFTGCWTRDGSKV